MNLSQIYHPITATPFNTEYYMEYEPCEELKPYIRCFWETKTTYIQGETIIDKRNIVIPDTCMDIMFEVDFTRNKIDNGFAGINDSFFETEQPKDMKTRKTTFAIRFYAWSVSLFAEDSLNDVKNRFFDVDCYFPKLKREIEPLLFDITDIKKLIPIAEKYLLSHLHIERENHILNDAVRDMILNQGNISMSQLGKSICISNRQLERVFKENMGISPKQFSSLVRYQYLWNHILFKKNIDILDEVYQLGYTDQAHLIKDFKRYHSLTPLQAKEFACHDVAFLHDE